MVPKDHEAEKAELFANPPLAKNLLLDVIDFEARRGVHATFLLVFGVALIVVSFVERQHANRESQLLHLGDRPFHFTRHCVCVFNVVGAAG